MKILLDSHMIIWALSNSPKLPEEARRLILDPQNEILVSVLSLWEIELKRLAKPDMMPFTARKIEDLCKASGFEVIPLEGKCVHFLQTLKRPESEPVHKDPFDRMLICQAASDDMVLLTHDSLIKGYESGNIQYVKAEKSYLKALT